MCADFEKLLTDAIWTADGKKTADDTRTSAVATLGAEFRGSTVAGVSKDDDAFRYLHLELTLCDPLQVSARWAIVSIQWAPHRPAETQSTTSRWCF